MDLSDCMSVVKRPIYESAINSKSESVYWIYKLTNNKVLSKPIWSGFASLAEARANYAHFKKIHKNIVLVNSFGHQVAEL